MRILESKVVTTLSPTGDNPRNSEGSFIRLNDGRILFAYSRFLKGGDGASDDAPCRIAGLYFDEKGETCLTDEPVTLASADEYGNDVQNVMSVSLARMQNGEIGMFFGVKHIGLIKDEYGRADGHLDFVLRRAKDNEPFTRESEVLCTTGVRAYYVMNNDRALRLSSGRLLLPFGRHILNYVNGRMAIEHRSEAHIFYSDDDGRSWCEAPGAVQLPNISVSRSGMQEPGLVELPNGVVWLHARTDLGFQYESYSYDGGMNWTGAQPSRFTSPESPLKVARNPYNGKYYAVWNPMPYYNGRPDVKVHWNRNPLVIAESTDGINFGGPTILENDPTRGYCYPAIFFVDEKTMLLSYCSGGPIYEKLVGGSHVLSEMTIRRLVIE
ncbi:MAG: exo-alpha-sialidase [Clostridia bacterium]|nr:exo-alpha-sialidase [Clostridia bacterium]